MRKVNQFIDGKEHISKSDRLGDIFNPAQGEKIAEVSLANKSDVDAAIKSALDVKQIWASTPPLTRSRIFFKFKELILRDMDKLAHALTEEHGKILSDSQGSITRGMEVVEFACGIPHLLKGEFSENVGSEIDSWSMRQPLGISVGISPFNFPAMVPMWMFPNALACGNAFILKPSERDPSVTLIIADLLKEAGLPEGIFSVVQGDKVVVDAILDNPEIKAVSFVGSTPVAEYIYTRGSGNGKRVQALGGAKNHMVIMPDADMDQVVDALMGAGYGSAGERCMAISVPVPVGEKVADELMERMIPLVKKLPVGPPSDSSVAMGPVITKQSLERITALLQSGVNQGAKLLVDGPSLKVPGHENGFFIGASLFDQVTTEMEIYKEEIFGPVLSSVRVSDYEEAIKLIHNNQYANGVAIFTRDGDAARDFVNRIEVGMVGVNVPIPVPVGYHSFGGWKKSLFGSHHIYGPDTIHFYTRLEAVTSRWPTGIKAGAQFNFPTMS